MAQSRRPSGPAPFAQTAAPTGGLVPEPATACHAPLPVPAVRKLPPRLEITRNARARFETGDLAGAYYPLFCLLETMSTLGSPLSCLSNTLYERLVDSGRGRNLCAFALANVVPVPSGSDRLRSMVFFSGVTS